MRRRAFFRASAPSSFANTLTKAHFPERVSARAVVVGLDGQRYLRLGGRGRDGARQPHTIVELNLCGGVENVGSNRLLPAAASDQAAGRFNAGADHGRRPE